MMIFGHFRAALMTFAKPLKKILPVSKLSMLMSSSKEAPAQKALSPALYNMITVTSSLFPISVIVLASSCNTFPGSELLKGW
mgnify:CR=1 FL=1